MYKKSCMFIVQVSWETELQWVNKIVLLKRWSWKGSSSVILGSILHVHCSGLPEERAFEEIVLLRRWYWKGHSLVTQGKPLCIYCSGPLGDWAYQADMIALLGRWSCKGHSSFIALEGDLVRGIHHWHREASACSFRSPGRQNICWETEVYE